MKRIFIIASVCITNFLASQNDLDKQYTPPTSSIFNSAPKKGEITAKNAFKIMPTMAIRQKIVGYYEREITKPITLIAGIGKAFGDDVFQKAFLTVFTGWDNPDEKIFAEEILSNSKYTESTPLLMIGLRSYFGKRIFDGGYLDITYRNETMTYKFNDIYLKDKNYTSGIKTVDFKMHHIALGFGHSSKFGPNDKMVQEVFIQIGLKLITYNEIVKREIPPPGNNGVTINYERSGSYITENIVPAINIGYAIGFGF